MELDLVITWVDGEDPAWLAQYRRVSSEVGFVSTQGEFNARFDPADDLSVLLESIDKFAANLFRKVWIVHDSIQKPKVSRDYISLVSHSEIIPVEDLPVFNSYAIEPYLYRIPGLSERFVYSNDDCFFRIPVTRETFFDGDLPRVFASRPVLSLSELENVPRQTVAWQFALANTNNILNRYFNPHEPSDQYLRIHPAHLQAPLTKEICEKSWEIFGEALSTQSKFPFRCMAIEAGEVVASTSMLFQWVGLELGLAVLSRRPIEALGFRQPELMLSAP